MEFSFRPAFLAEGTYTEDAVTKREPFREEHMERIKKLIDEGAVVLAAGFDDLSGSMLVIKVETDEAAKAIMESDIYWKKGIWTDYRIRKVNTVHFPDE